MGTIIKKKVKNGSYYYYVESKRINGKPKFVNQKYLGTAEKVLAKALSYEQPLQERVLYSHVMEFGAVTLLYDLAARLGIVSIIDSVVAKRKQGASVGMYILMEAINRAVAPTSTLRLEDWFSGTTLPSLTGIKANAYTAQNFWNNTNIAEESIQEMENEILKTIFQSYDIDTSHIIYDATNFFTYIDTKNKCETAQRGHSKEKHNDLRIVGLSLMVSPDFSIPLLHEVYPGNRSDSIEFAVMMQSLKQRYEKITGKKTDITVVFDRGNNGEENIELLESGQQPFHYVGGLKKNQAKELFAISKAEYKPLNPELFPGQSSYRMKTKAFGREVTAVIVYNPALFDGQLQGIRHNIEKASKKMMDLQQRLLLRSKGIIKKGRKPTKDSVSKSVKGILKEEYMGEIFTHEIVENEGNIYLTFAITPETLDEIFEKELGKTALFTDRDDFSDEEIVKAYRSAWHVESSFRQLKDTDHLTVRPIFHWTDDRIRVHIFTCVLAYRMCCLLRKELTEKGIELSINRILEEVAAIRKVTTFFGDLDKPEKVESFTIGSEQGEAIEQIYQLKEKYR
jgi:transposase